MGMFSDVLKCCPSIVQRWIGAWLPLTGLLAAAVIFTWLNVPLCPFKALTDRDCPTCGTTRALMAILTGDAIQAARLNPISFVVIGALIRHGILGSM
jgi:hypothetical protein